MNPSLTPMSGYTRAVCRQWIVSLATLDPGLSSPNLALSDFAGTDLLKLTRQDLIQICGAADWIHIFNTLRARCWAWPTRVPFSL